MINTVFRMLAGALSTTFFVHCTTIGNLPEKEVVVPEALSPSLEIPTAEGLAWLPFSWTIRIDKSNSKEIGNPPSQLQIRKVGFLITNAKTGNELFVRLKNKRGESNVGLERDKKVDIFYGPPAVKLPAGQYELSKVRLYLVDSGGQEAKLVEIPIANPLNTNAAKPLTFTVLTGKVAAVSRLAVQTAFGQKGGKLQSKTDVEAVDKDVTPVDVAIKQLNAKSSNASKIFAASVDLPRSRVQLSPPIEGMGAVEPPLARLGVIFSVPCKADGIVRFVWKRTGDTREYVTLFRVAETKESGKCQEPREMSREFFLPKGDWFLTSNLISPVKNPQSKFYLETLETPDAHTSSYYHLDLAALSLAGIREERPVERQIAVRLQNSRSFSGNEVLYMGKFELTPGTKEGSWDTLFKRDYKVDKLKQKFSSDRVYSAYSLKPLVRDRLQGTLRGVLRTKTSAEKSSKNTSTVAAEIRSFALEKAAECLVEREETDPLINVTGSFTFLTLKGEQTLSLTKVTAVSDNKEPEPALASCFEKRIRTFRFSKPLTTNLEGEFEFISE